MATVQQIIDDAVDFAVKMANDNSHGYSQATRSLYNITNPTSFDCSSLVCTAYYYAFIKHGISPTPKDCGCSYTGNMLNLQNCGFEIVATNQTAHASMKKGDIELNQTYHTALAIDSNNIVHARTSEGTSDTKDGSGNEIRTQSWYLYSHGWTHRLRFTGKGLNISGATSNSSTNVPSSSTSSTNRSYLMKGDKGSAVVTMQTMLIKCGYSCGSYGADGDFGDGTDSALRKFQKAYGLEVDGKYGNVSKAKLTEVYNSKIGTSSSSSTTASKYKVGATYTVCVNNLNVRTGAGTNYAKKSKAQLTADGKKNSNANGQYMNGTKVTCQAVKTVGNNVWMQTLSGWICAICNGDAYVK